MRVITGSARGTKLITPEGTRTRPTGSKIKGAIFSAIQFDLEGAVVLDLFAGSGQLGIEALSRGAKTAVFIDSDKICQEIIMENLHNTKLAKHARVAGTDATVFLMHTKDKYDFVFVDPPYENNLVAALLEKISPVVAVGGAVICETETTDLLPEKAGDLVLHKKYEHGRVKVTVYHKETEV